MALPGVLDVILGRDGASVAVQDATLDDYALPVRGAVFALARHEAGAKLPGRLLADVPDGAAARLAYFRAAIGADSGKAPCESADGNVIVTLALARDGHGGPGGDTAPAAMAVSAAVEIMGYHGRLPVSTVAQRMPMILARAASEVAAARGKPVALRSDTGRDRVEVDRSETPHEGFFLTRTQHLRHPTFAGGKSPVVTREVFVATDAAIVLPYDAKRDRVLLVEQFRMGPFGRGDVRPWTLEPVAGRIDAGETPGQTARRECEEEAGLVLKGLEHISSHYCSPGCSTEYFHIFLGLADLPDKSKGRGGLDAEDEDIRTHVIGFDAAMGLLETGEADNGPLVLALLWLARNRDRLRAVA